MTIHPPPPPIAQIKNELNYTSTCPPAYMVSMGQHYFYLLKSPNQQTLYITQCSNII
jgi:hypothetical protein